MKHTIILLLAAIFGIFYTHAEISPRHKALITKEQEKLSGTKSAADSIAIFYNIFDLSDHENRLATARKIYDVAKRSGNTNVQLEVCRVLAYNNLSDDALEKIEKELTNIPSSKAKEETLLFIKLKRIAAKSNALSDEKSKEVITNAINSIENTGHKSQYDDLLNLYTIVAFLRNDVSGEMMIDYLEKLSAKVDKMTFTINAVPDFIYSELADTYSDSGYQKKGFELDKKLQQVLITLKQKYGHKGREYRTFAMAQYISYRRMLRNYEQLTAQEAKDVYEKVMALAAIDDEVKQDINSNPRFYAFYYMNTGEYSKAIPYLKKLIAEDTSLGLKRRALEMLRKAATETHDNTSLVEALSQYVDVLEKIDSLNDTEKYKELQIRYDVQQLKTENSALEKQNLAEQETSERRTMSFLMLAILVIGVAIVIFLYFWTRHRMATSAFIKFYNSLVKERNRIRDNQYYDYAKPQHAPRSSAGRRKSGAKRRIVRPSADVLNSIFCNLFYIASMGRRDRVKYVRRIHLDQIMRECARGIESAIKPGVNFNIEFPAENIEMFTDSEVLEYIIRHILNNSAQYTTSGEISFSASVDKTGGKVTFRFTDSGEAIPTGDEQYLFDNFVNLEQVSDMKDGGLFFCRMNSMLLKCDLLVDKSYKQGVRFLFHVPVDIVLPIK
ncbi:MAG: ATP-binding protein [Candidatus Amulumruptor caecigallinarius]|nr:ATP-binding protein [Candidatus Amulumruptor caecigallinarius]